MPVSKKRKKDGKPVHRQAAPEPGEEGHVPAPDAKVAPPATRGGKPSNPFVAQQGTRRGAQRGR